MELVQGRKFIALGFRRVMSNPDLTIQVPAFGILWRDMHDSYLTAMMHHLHVIEGYVIRDGRPLREIVDILNDLKAEDAGGLPVSDVSVREVTGQHVAMFCCDRQQNNWLLWRHAEPGKSMIGLTARPRNKIRDPRLRLFREYCVTLSDGGLAIRVFHNGEYCWTKIPTRMGGERNDRGIYN